MKKSILTLFLTLSLSTPLLYSAAPTSQPNFRFGYDEHKGSDTEEEEYDSSNPKDEREISRTNPAALQQRSALAEAPRVNQPTITATPAQEKALADLLARCDQAKAAIVDAYLVKDIEAHCQAEGWTIEMKNAPNKGRERILVKANEKYHGDITRLQDIVRFTVICDDIPTLYQVVDFMHTYTQDPRKLLRITREKDSFKHPTDQGYRDYKINLYNAEPHRIYVEMQVNLASMVDAKEQAHILYKKTRLPGADPNQFGEAAPLIYEEAWREGKNSQGEKVHHAQAYKALKQKTHKALIDAIQHQNLDQLEAALKPSIAELLPEEGPTPFFFALAKGHPPTIQRLFQDRHMNPKHDPHLPFVMYSQGSHWCETDPQQALQALEGIVALTEQAKNLPQALTALLHATLSCAHCHQGNGDSTLHHSTHAIEQYEKEDPTHAICCWHRSKCYASTQAWKKARQDAQKALDILQDTLGEHHPRTAEAACFLADLFREQEEHAQAATYYEQA